MSSCLETLLADQRKIEDRRAPPKAPDQMSIGRAATIIANGHKARMAYRCKYPDADTAMVYGAQIGYLHGEIRRLCDEIDASAAFERDPELLYFKVPCDEMDADVWAGVMYDPGDYETGESTELMEVWVGCVNVAQTLDNRVADQILDNAVKALHDLQGCLLKDDDADRGVW